MLELSSNTIKVLGIFGRLAPEQESLLDDIERKYSAKPGPEAGYDIFRHLTLTFISNATIKDVNQQLDLLRDLKAFLPLKIKPLDLFVKDEESMEGAEHIAVEFGLEQTKNLVQFVRDRTGDNTVATHYIKVVWFVPKENQEKAIAELRKIEELVFTDFYLVSNKQNNENTIYRSSQFYD